MAVPTDERRLTFDLLRPRSLLALTLGLPPPRNPVAVRRAIPVLMPDGVRLFSDHYVPQTTGSCPTILIRTPYGRATETRFGPGFSLAELPARRFAERGYQVLVQGVRGCFASEGSFTPHINEAADGAATIAWIRRQPWFNGMLGTWGPSYLGYTQWAAAGAVPDAVQAMVASMTSAEPFSITYPTAPLHLKRGCAGPRVSIFCVVCIAVIGAPYSAWMPGSAGPSRPCRSRKPILLPPAGRSRVFRLPYAIRNPICRSGAIVITARSSARSPRRCILSAVGTITSCARCCAIMRYWPQPGVLRSSPSAPGLTPIPGR